MFSFSEFSNNTTSDIDIIITKNINGVNHHINVEAVIDSEVVERNADELVLDFVVVSKKVCVVYDDDDNELPNVDVSDDEIIAFINDLDSRTFTRFHRHMEYLYEANYGNYDEQMTEYRLSQIYDYY